MPVEHRADIVRVNALDHEREHRRLLPRRADDRKAGNLRESASVP
jgi:hypothetical protein